MEEDDLNNAQSIRNNEDVVGWQDGLIRFPSTLVTVETDEPGTFSFKTTYSSLISQGFASDADELSYSVAGDTLTAKAGALTVFTWQVTARGDYKVHPGLPARSCVGQLRRTA